ncbi:GxxExxY protein [Verrucomicrobiales bacterium BCK34]|nr:GxxExxY protein [Verrucomicrobiales bacterium BCK34]
METNDLTYAVIGCAMRVHNELGPGLREKPYENALTFDLDEQGLSFVQQPAYPILYHGRVAGECIPDLVVGGKVVVETKAIDKLGDGEIAQMLNYLRISKNRIGLVINFGPTKLEWKRVVI